MPFATDLIAPAITRYHRERDRYSKLAEGVAQICREDVCEQNAIRAQVTFRVKSEKSFERKLYRLSKQSNRNFQGDDDIFKAIGDLAGVRISAYQEKDCDRIVEQLKRVFRGPAGFSEVLIDKKDKNVHSSENYYRSIHVQVSLPVEQLVGPYDNLEATSCEIQVCTMMAHVWNEIEHDIGYKPAQGEPSSSQKFYLRMLGMLVRHGDDLISSLMVAHEQQVIGQNNENKAESIDRIFVDVHDFVSRMRNFGGNAMPNFAENSGQLFDLLVDLNATSPSELHRILPDQALDEDKRRFEEFKANLENSGDIDLSLDSSTSDLMLIALIERNQELVTRALLGRAGRGKGRPTRLYRIARRYIDSRNAAD